jgi:type 1 glutamine amidotransferase
MLKKLLLACALVLGLGLSAANAAPAHIVMMIGEDEYHTWETLPEYAGSDLKAAGYRVTIVHADAKDKNNFPGIEAALRDADLLLVSVRRRTPVKEQLDAVRAYLATGKPLVGIRTASHAFALARNAKALTDPKLAIWQDFDPEVLGGRYTNHYKAGIVCTATVAPGAAKHPILRGVNVATLTSPRSLYKVSPLVNGTVPLVIGTIPNESAEPIAWTHLYGAKKGRIFYTSMGDPDDFKQADFRRLLGNSIAWALGK